MGEDMDTKEARGKEEYNHKVKFHIYSSLVTKLSQ
jgi:hypothetical protein